MTERKIKALIFDMDGVLINTEPMHYRMWKKTFEQHGVEIEYDIYKACIGTTHEFLRDLIRDNYGADFRGNSSIKKEAMAIKKQMISEEGFPKIKGVPEMLKAFYDAGYLLAIASSSPVDYIELAMKYLGVKDYFTVINSGEYVAHSKPAPDIYLNTAQKLGVKPEQCVVLEDSTNGCISATSAGMLCVGFLNPDSGTQDLSRACKVITDMSQYTDELVCSLEKNYL